MGDWRDAFRSTGNQSGVLHPYARVGGAGPAAPPTPTVAWEADVPHPGSRSASMFDWVSLPDFELIDRAYAVYETVEVAREHAIGAVLEETGEALGEILDGVLYGLLFAMAVIATTTAIGGAAGAAVGALAGGIGAAPGAVAGAGIGLDLGIALLEFLGLAFLVASIGASLLEASNLAAEAIVEAWGAVDDPRSRGFHVDRAGKRLAKAFGVLMRGVLEGLVAFLLAKGTAAAASRVPEVVAKLKASRLGAAFATWLERNWQRLLNNDKLKPKPPSGGGTTPDAPPPPPPAPPPKPAPPKPGDPAPPKPGDPAPPKPKPKPDEEQPGPKPKSRAERLEELSKDPDHDGKITPNSRREAEVALDMEETGRLKPPVRRPQKGDGHSGDFVDGDGKDWDMKRPRSRAEVIKDIQAEAAANGKPPPKLNPNKKIKGEYETAKTVEEIKGEIRSGEDVIIDTSKMEPGQVTDLKSAVQAEGLGQHVTFYP